MVWWSILNLKKWYWGFIKASLLWKKDINIYLTIMIGNFKYSEESEVHSLRKKTFSWWDERQELRSIDVVLWSHFQTSTVNFSDINLQCISHSLTQKATVAKIAYTICDGMIIVLSVSFLFTMITSTKLLKNQVEVFV